MRAFVVLILTASVLSLSAQSAEWYYNKAVRLIDSLDRSGGAGDFSVANKYLQKALSIDPLFYKAEFEIGKLFLRARNYQMAVDYFSRAIQTDPKAGYLFLYRGKAYCEGGRPEQGCEDLQQALDPNDKDAMALMNIYCR